MRRILTLPWLPALWPVFALTTLSASDRALLSGQCHGGRGGGTGGATSFTAVGDAAQIRTGSGPQVMAALRNLAIGIVKTAGHARIAAACRHHA